MNVYGELDSMVEHRKKFTFKGKREHIAKANTPNIAYPSQRIDIEIPHGSRDHVIVPDTAKITFNLEIESTDKTRGVVNNAGRALDMINNSDIYDTYKDLYLSKKEHEENLLQGIQSTNGLKARLGAKKADGTALTVTTQENAIKKTLDKRFTILLEFDLFKHPVYPCGLKERLFIRIELNSAGKVPMCTGETNVIYQISDIFLEYDAIFDDLYATSISEMYIGTMSIPYTKVTSIHYESLKNKGTVWKIDVNNLSVRSLLALLKLFLGKRNDCVKKNEEFYNPSINKILVTINGMPYQLYAGGLQGRDIYPELKKYFYKENSDVTWEECLAIKFGLWIDKRSSTDNTLHGSGRAVNQGISLQIEKASEASCSDLMCYVFSLDYSVAHLSVTNSSGILTIEK